jgi:xylulokinase
LKAQHGRDPERSSLKKAGDLLMGIDLGTSGVKVGIYNSVGRLFGLGRSSKYDVVSPQPGWSQNDPESWWDALILAMQDSFSKARIKGSDIKAVGLSTIFPVVIPLDPNGFPTHPAILYSDRRSIKQVNDIFGRISREKYQAITGNVLVPGNSSVASMAWLRDEKPDIYGSAKVLGSANTYITARLTGGFYTDTTNAALSGLTDINKPWQWSEELCDVCSIDSDRLPDIKNPDEVIGEIGRAVSEKTDLKTGTPVVCGCGDAVASPFGAGAHTEGSIVYTAGTTDCVTVGLSKPAKDLRWVSTANIPHKSWCAIGTTTSSGASIEWFKKVFYKQKITNSRSRSDIYKIMTELAGSCPAGSRGVLYLPYLQGERTPLWDPLARGMFIGLKTSTSIGALTRAVFEGTALSLRDVIECLEGVVSDPVKEIRAVGGCTKSRLWNQIKADILCKPIDVLQFQETGSLGAALLAGIGSGVYASYEEASNVAREVIDVKRVEPDPDNRQMYDELFSIYKEVYPSIKRSVHRLVKNIETEQ